MTKKNVLAICGSTRQNSTNHRLIKAIATLEAATIELTIFDRLEFLPQFNPDKDMEHVAVEVAAFRKQIDDADGVLICTPEYAHGVPGALKNAIDWTISTGQFPRKPTFLITASTGGYHGHKALLETLKAIEAANVEKLQMVIPFVKTKISENNQVTDEKTFPELRLLLIEFLETMNTSKATA